MLALNYNLVLESIKTRWLFFNVSLSLSLRFCVFLVLSVYYMLLGLKSRTFQFLMGWVSCGKRWLLALELISFCTFSVPDFFRVTGLKGSSEIFAVHSI